jgi:predicted nuclease with TOPRIM domain
MATEKASTFELIQSEINDDFESRLKRLEEKVFGVEEDMLTQTCAEMENITNKKNIKTLLEESDRLRDNAKRLLKKAVEMRARIAELEAEVERLKARQLGPYQVAYEVPELLEDGHCDSMCKMNHLGKCPYVIGYARCDPGPGCPRYKGAEK